jgi:hypothetical protein
MLQQEYEGIRISQSTRHAAGQGIFPGAGISMCGKPSLISSETLNVQKISEMHESGRFYPASPTWEDGSQVPAREDGIVAVMVYNRSKESTYQLFRMASKGSIRDLQTDQ